MIYRERSRRAAVATATAATRDELQPLGDRVRARGAENPRSSPLPDRSTDLAASRFPVASTLAMLLRMLCAPAPHREPRLVEVSPHPVAGIGAAPIAIRCRARRPSSRQARPWQ